VPLATPAVSSRYSVGGHTGFAIFNFEIAAPGAYSLSAFYEDGRSEPSTILAIASGFTHRLVFTILGFLAIVFSSVAAALAIGITTFVRRRRYRRRTAAGPTP
jgi:hypothetical protein